MRVGADTSAVERRWKWHGVETARDNSASAIECALQQMEVSLRLKRVKSGHRVNVTPFSFSAYFPFIFGTLDDKNTIIQM